MAMFLIVAQRSGPSRDPSEDAVLATLSRDPWSETHLVIDTIEPWTIRLDGRTLRAGVSERSTRA